MKKTIVIGLFLAFAGIAALSAEAVTTVGIIDIARVSSVFFRDSQAFRELEETRVRFQQEIDAITREINQLRERKLQADANRDRQLSLQLDQEIADRTNFLRDFHRIRTNQIQERQNRLSESSEFLEQIQRAIAFVAEEQGYSVVLKSSDPGLVWWSRQVDITELVVQFLLRQNRR